MAYRYQSRRAVKRLARKSQKNFIITLVITGILIYATFTWVLPAFIGSIGFIKNITSPQTKSVTQPSENVSLAPPVLNIPYEATNTAQIDLSGFGTPGSKVKLYLDDDLKQTIDVSSDGSFTFKDIALSLGTNNIYGKTIDDNGKESLPSKTIRLLYDNEKPSLTISEPEDNKTVQGSDKKIKVSGKTDPGVQIFVNGTQVIVDQNGNFSQDLALNDGDNIFSIKAVDIASNTTELQRKVIYTP